MAYPRYKGPEGVEEFTRSLVEESGVLLLPGSVYQSTLNPPTVGHFRIGYGRSGIDEGLAVMEAHIMRNNA
jgi:aspartate/methionine/tyrosine aminotransferase